MLHTNIVTIQLFDGLYKACTCLDLNQIPVVSVVDAVLAPF